MKKQDILIILIPTLILCFAWIGFNIYHSAVTPTIPEAEYNQLVPIVPNFNTSVIDQLKQRTNIAPLLESISITPTPFVKVGSTAAELTPQATSGGLLK